LEKFKDIKIVASKIIEEVLIEEVIKEVVRIPAK
jgi:hypothetical protein